MRDFSYYDFGKLFKKRKHIIDRSLMKSAVCGKSVLITGGAGSIGSELAMQTLADGAEFLTVLDDCEKNVFELERALRNAGYADFAVKIGSVRDKDRLTNVFGCKPDLVFHAAAYKHVPLMESNVCEAVKTNVFGTQNVFDVCEASGASKCVLVSTDKAVRPSSVMGATKRAAEKLLAERASRASSTVFSAVRFGNVLGSCGSVAEVFDAQLTAGKPLTVTDKRMIRYMMTAEEAVAFITEVSAISKQGELYMLDMGEQIPITELARYMARKRYPNLDYALEETGIRPGEKLSEELCFTDEDFVEASLAGAACCKLKPSGRSASDLINALCAAVKTGDDGRARDLLMEFAAD